MSCKQGVGFYQKLFKKMIFSLLCTVFVDFCINIDKHFLFKNKLGSLYCLFHIVPIVHLLLKLIVVLYPDKTLCNLASL